MLLEGLSFWREARNMSVQQLADRMGLNRLSIWRYETLEREPTPETVGKLAKILDVDPEDLYTKPEVDKLRINYPKSLAVANEVGTAREFARVGGETPSRAALI